MSNLEVQRNIPNGSPSKPSDILLKNFRTTLTKRWNEFDQATLQEAQVQIDNHILGGFTDVKSQRDKDANFIKAKATFDEAMSALAVIDTDAKLKQTLETPGQLGSTINSLKDYLAKADAQKSYNAVLSHTLADLTGLKAQMTETVEDKRDADVARAAVPVLLTSTGATLGNEAMSGLSNVVKDGTKVVQQEIVNAKKNPIKTIAEFLGFSESNILTDYREALTEKKAGGFDAMFAGLKIWFYGLMAKWIGVDIAKSLSPEELKIAGLKVKSESLKSNIEIKSNTPDEVRAQSEDVSNKLITVATSKFFMHRTRTKEYDGFWSAGYAGLKNATWGKDEKDRKNQIEAKSTEMLGWPGVSKQKVSTILGMKDDQNPDISLRLENTTALEKSALNLAIFTFVKNESFIEKMIGKKYPNWKDMSMSVLLSEFYTYTGLATMEKVSEVIKSVNWNEDGHKISEKFRALAISKNPQTGQWTGYLGDKLSKLSEQGIDSQVITNILVPGLEGENTVESYRVTLKNNPFNDLQKTQPFMEKLTEKGGFSKGVIGMMNAIGLDIYTSDLKQGENIHMDELLQVYAVTNGQVDITNMSLAEQSELIPVLYSIAGRLNPGILGTQTFAELITGSTNPYITRMSEFVGNAISDATYISVLGTMNFTRASAEGFLSLRESSPKIFYGTILAVIFSVGAGVYLRRPIATAGLSAALFIAGAKLAGLTMVTTK